ncbi:MAG TPA: MlaD family protein [Solirubrobacteraceae bacterium]|jgi:phospholipid/cholesterol/gamma-HCH transport system substrate-binding protein|nr:MlaD family protein [Solirubrobacteraceae bacterium]
MSAPRWWRRQQRVPVIELQRSNPVRAGIVLVVIVVIAVYFGFTKHIPFKHGFRLKAEFASAVNIHSASPVRIAGVTIGKVSSIQRTGNTGLVTMEIESRGLPIHTDATVKIRPRLFLEGNWFVELQPGSPSAKTVSSGYTIPVTQTSDPVQLDQVLDALNTDTRANLQSFLINYGEALTRKPEAPENAEQEPEVRGLNAAEALNKIYSRGPASLRGGAIDAQAVTGTQQHDLSKLIASLGKVTAALNVHEQDLSELFPNFNTFAAALASNSANLKTLVAELPATLSNVDAGLAGLDASFPPTREFAHDILPGIRNTNRMVAATLPWIEQVQASLAPAELGGVASGLKESVPSLARLASEQTPVYKQTEAFNKCMTKVIFPAGNTKIQDGSSTTGVENYKEFWYSLVGLDSIGQNFTGNGPSVRFLLGNSGQTLRSQPTSLLGTKLKGAPLLARSPLPPQGTRPAFPAEEPPYEPLVPCDTQALPSFNGPLSQGPADGSGQG